MTVPSLVQITNIERTLNDYVWAEIRATHQKAEELMERVQALRDREERLRCIAIAAEIAEPDEATTQPRTAPMPSITDAWVAEHSDPLPQPPEGDV